MVQEIDRWRVREETGRWRLRNKGQGNGGELWELFGSLSVKSLWKILAKASAVTLSQEASVRAHVFAGP